MRIIRVCGGLVVRITLTNDPGFRPFFYFVVYLEKVLREPTIHHVYGRWTTMPALVVVNMRRQSHFLSGHINTVTMFWHHVPIIEPVCHEQGRFHISHLV